MRNIPIHFLLLLCFLQRMYRLVIFLEMESVNIYSAFMSVDKLIYFAGDYISKYKNGKKYGSFFLCVLNGDYKNWKCQLFGGLCLLLCGQSSVIRCKRYDLAIPRFCFFKYSGTFKKILIYSPQSTWRHQLTITASYVHIFRWRRVNKQILFDAECIQDQNKTQSMKQHFV